MTSYVFNSAVRLLRFNDKDSWHNTPDTNTNTKYHLLTLLKWFRNNIPELDTNIYLSRSYCNLAPNQFHSTSHCAVCLLTYNNEVNVAGGQVESGAEGAEHLDARLRPQREDGAADSVDHGRAHEVFRLRRRHVHVEVLHLFM